MSGANSFSSWIRFTNEKNPTAASVHDIHCYRPRVINFKWVVFPCCGHDFDNVNHVNPLQNWQRHWCACVYDERRAENLKATVQVINSEHHFVLTISKFLLLLMPSEIRHTNTPQPFSYQLTHFSSLTKNKKSDSKQHSCSKITKELEGMWPTDQIKVTTLLSWRHNLVKISDPPPDQKKIDSTWNYFSSRQKSWSLTSGL